MRGQISVEYLSLSLIILALLSISIYALYSAREFSNQSISLFKFRSSASLLSNTMEEVCTLGNGNVQKLSLPVKILITSSQDNSGPGTIVRFTFGNTSSTSKINCAFKSAASLEGHIKISNEEGTVFLQQS